MTIVTAKITSKGQITLPKEVREKLGLVSGDTVRFEIEAGEVRVYPERNFDFATLIGVAPLSEAWDALSADEVIENLRGEAEERVAIKEAPKHPNITRLGER